MNCRIITFTLLMSVFFAHLNLNAQVTIGAGVAPHKSAVLELVSTDKALLLSRVNSADIIAPVDGMIVYDNFRFCYRAYSEGDWINLTSCKPVPATWSLISVKSYPTGSIMGAPGIGYNGEPIPEANTIIVNVEVIAIGDYNVSAIHPESGLEYLASGYFQNIGEQTITLLHNGITIPSTVYGKLDMTLIGNAENQLELSPRIDIKTLRASETHVEAVYSTLTDTWWMDRNLGARRVAEASNDPLGFGSYFQWGRNSDDHEIVVMKGDDPTTGRGFYGTTKVLADADILEHNIFITNSSIPHDWRADRNNERWASAVQGPCPNNYRLPTEPELDRERASWVSQDIAGALNSELKLPMTGFRGYGAGNYEKPQLEGAYWSSTINKEQSRALELKKDEAPQMVDHYRGRGFTVRCIKNN